MNTNNKMSMPVITLTPPEIIKNSSSREASFSSYLDGAEETFVLKLGAAAITTKPLIHHPKNTPDDKEIDVFDAEKYFNDALNHSPKLCTKSSSHKKDDHLTPTAAVKPQSPTAALSIRSESSWNSQSALIHTRNVSRSQRKGSMKSFLASIGCNCACADKEAVETDDQLTGPHFTFPVFASKAGKMEKVEATKRVFGSPIISSKNKLGMVNWDAIAPSQAHEELKIPSISSEMYNDSDSDASSDLFEIESLYKDNPSMTPTTCYAPSEASVEWSVVTASAVDFSLLSDSDEVGPPCPKRGSKTGSRIRPSILSGCKSHKAVSVAGDAHARRHVMTRCHDESDVKTRKDSFGARITNRPRCASAAHLLYILGLKLHVFVLSLKNN